MLASPVAGPFAGASWPPWAFLYLVRRLLNQPLSRLSATPCTDVVGSSLSTCRSCRVGLAFLFKKKFSRKSCCNPLHSILCLLGATPTASLSHGVSFLFLGSRTSIPIIEPPRGSHYHLTMEDYRCVAHRVCSEGASDTTKRWYLGYMKHCIIENYDGQTSWFNIIWGSDSQS